MSSGSRQTDSHTTAVCTHTHTHTQHEEHMGIPGFHEWGYWERFLTKLLINKNISISSLSYSSLPLFPFCQVSFPSCHCPVSSRRHFPQFFVYLTSRPAHHCVTPQNTNAHNAGVTLFPVSLKAVPSFQADAAQHGDSYSVLPPNSWGGVTGQCMGSG